MPRLGLVSIALAGTLIGCDNSLDSIDGHHLGKPESVIFGTNDSGHTMLAMSDLPNLCEAVRSADPPERNDFWVLSTWTHVDAETLDRYVVDAFAAITDNGAVHEYTIESVTFTSSRTTSASSRPMSTSTSRRVDTVSAEVEGRHCDANLFVGLRRRVR